MPAVKDLEEVADLVSIAITREQASVKIYTNAYEKTTSENARRIFSLMIDQDRGHEAQLRAHLQEIKSEIASEKARMKKRARQ